MKLTALTKEQCEKVRQWRNLDISMYRTSYYITPEMQENFYHDVICNRKSDHRYYSIVMDCGDHQPDKECFHFVGMIGFVNISLENRNAEISIVIDPDIRHKGIGEKALSLLLHEGFNNLNLENIYGECYCCSPFIDFWKRMIEKHEIKFEVLPYRKYWNGEYHNSIYFNFNKSEFYN